MIDAFDMLTNGGAVNVQAAHEQLFNDVFGWWVWINNSSNSSSSHMTPRWNAKRRRASDPSSNTPWSCSG
ncbi:MAG: hypothetical protein GEV28_11715 [Actinophytocola sp.]|uniref:hypothetical protein n=1 Tax=Actinophytocola sp. TaxID=1872138 RepID=UPI001328BB27|nr:hypothetical protein [Actinophytocola sp.]MPZ81020.1 hypothetical protein [Actinophytocola sp.]